MKKSIWLSLLVVLILGTCVGMAFPFRHWFIPFRNNARCLPLDYAEGSSGAPEAQQHDPENYIPYVFRTETPLATIKDYYDDNLLLAPDWNNYEEGRWVRSEVRPGEFLYECGASLNWEEAERGCIYLRERDRKAVIETMWLFSATSAPACEWYMSELPY